MRNRISNFRFQISGHSRQRLAPIRLRCGLTLLELILALGLSVVLLFAVTMAMQIYWRAFDVKRTNVEQAHLARALLRHIEDDLRSAVQYTPVDLSGLDSMTNSSSVANLASSAGISTGQTSGSTPGAGGSGASASPTQGGQTGQTKGGSGGTSQPMTPTQPAGAAGNSPSGSASSGGSPTGGNQSGGAPTSGNSSSGSPSSGGSAPAQPSATQQGAAETTESTEGVPVSVVGLYGSATQLQFDVSRLPRVDQYQVAGTVSMAQIPSDIKTITYFVRDEASAGGSAALFGGSQFGSGQPTSPSASSKPSAAGQGRGLMRLEVDRAVGAYEESNGTVSAGYDGAKLLAEEVTGIQFRYWDGTDWVEDWNSDEMRGLPLAIEVLITMDDPSALATAAPQPSSFAASAKQPAEPTPYRMVVHLPTANPSPPAEEPETDGAASDPATTGSASTGSKSSSSPSSSSTSGSLGASSSPATSSSSTKGSAK